MERLTPPGWLIAILHWRKTAAKGSPVRVRIEDCLEQPIQKVKCHRDEI